MLIDLFNTDNYVSYSVKMAERFGLKTAIYLSEIMNISSKATRKNKLDDGYFTLNREYLRLRTTITDKEQLIIEKQLQSVGIIDKKGNTTKLKINVNTLINIMADESIEFINDLHKVMQIKATNQKSDSKRSFIVKAIISNIRTEIPELRDAYVNWIQALDSANKCMTVATIIKAENTISRYAGNNVDVAIKIIEIAAIHGWIEMEYAINRYESDKNNKQRFEFETVKPNNSNLEVGNVY